MMTKYRFAREEDRYRRCVLSGMAWQGLFRREKYCTLYERTRMILETLSEMTNSVFISIRIGKRKKGGHILKGKV